MDRRLDLDMSNHQDVFFFYVPLRVFIVLCHQAIFFYDVCFSKKEEEEQETVGRAELDLERLKVFQHTYIQKGHHEPSF